MNILLIAIFGLFIALVGLNGNSAVLRDYVKADMSGFIPWAVSIGALAIMSEIPLTKKIVAPFLLLLALNFVLRNWSTLVNQYQGVVALTRSN